MHILLPWVCGGAPPEFIFDFITSFWKFLKIINKDVGFFCIVNADMIPTVLKKLYCLFSVYLKFTLFRSGF